MFCYLGHCSMPSCLIAPDNYPSWEKKSFGNRQIEHGTPNRRKELQGKKKSYGIKLHLRQNTLKQQGRWKKKICLVPIMFNNKKQQCAVHRHIGFLASGNPDGKQRRISFLHNCPIHSNALWWLLSGCAILLLTIKDKTQKMPARCF